MKKQIFIPGHLFHDGIGIWVDDELSAPHRGETEKNMKDNLILVEATVYDNITEENGRQEVLIALRSQRDTITKLRSMLTDAETLRAQQAETIAARDARIEQLENLLKPFSIPNPIIGWQWRNDCDNARKYFLENK